VATLYADTSDLQTVLDGTDSGTGTAAQLTPAQLTLALTAASNRISVFTGQVFDSSTPDAVPPAIFHDLCLDLAAFFATTTYMKSKTIAATHPVYLRYTDAMNILKDVRDGTLRLDVAPPGGGDTMGEGAVINRIPRVFTGDDSNTRFDPITGALEADSPFWTPNWNDLADGGGGPVYQG
jgi:phage gp36-like protein